ncbi:Pao retrotransposon peptidase [Popillia japonica]|uniref:Pao retrotransposon peptidase n=1 Tax=Popillia japonica TaxID=7064 RepID=A0AAW1M292_POPJA
MCYFPSIRKLHQIEIHGFCDASETAYGACIYLKSTDLAGSAICNLLCCKSRVAPLKSISIPRLELCGAVRIKSRVAPLKSISIPRLELCGAVLFAPLVAKIVDSINIAFDTICYWTDSTIVLAWLKSLNKQWKTFVANRVSIINTLTETSAWRHVRSEENPADILSRGMFVSILHKSKIRWHGPAFLQNADCNEIAYEIPKGLIIPEERRVIVGLPNINETRNNLFSRYSSLSKLIRRWEIEHGDKTTIYKALVCGTILRLLPEYIQDTRYSRRKNSLHLSAL